MSNCLCLVKLLSNFPHNLSFMCPTGTLFFPSFSIPFNLFYFFFPSFSAYIFYRFLLFSPFVLCLISPFIFPSTLSVVLFCHYFLSSPGTLLTLTLTIYQWDAASNCSCFNYTTIEAIISPKLPK